MSILLSLFKSAVSTFCGSKRTAFLSLCTVLSLSFCINAVADIIVDGVVKKDNGYYGSNYGDYTLHSSAGTVVVGGNSTLTSWATINNLITENQSGPLTVQSHDNIKNVTINGGYVYNYQNIDMAVVNRGTLGNGGWDTPNNAGSPVTGATVKKVTINGGSVINWAHSESIGPYERGQIDSVVIYNGTLANYGYVKDVEFYDGMINFSHNDSQIDNLFVRGNGTLYVSSSTLENSIQNILFDMSEMSKITFNNESSGNYFGNVVGGIYLDFTNTVLSADYTSFDMNDRFSTWKDVWQGLFGLTDAAKYQYYFDSEEGNMLWVKLNNNPAVPEPATVLIFGLGVGGAALTRIVRLKRK